MEKERIEHQAIGGKEGLEQGLEDKEGKEDKEDEGKEVGIGCRKEAGREPSRLEKAKLVQGKIASAKKVLIGIGQEWKAGGRLSAGENDRVRKAYEGLRCLVKDKDYFIVTTLTDGAVYEAGFDRDRIVAPCGNEHWLQCAKACTKDIWEEGEAEGLSCPHCGGPLTANTIKAEHYIEEGYLPMWRAYQAWLAGTLNRELAVLELGEGFNAPTVIRWPFEKTVFFNRKAWMFRVHREFFQVAAEIRERSTPVAEDSAEWIAFAAGHEA